MKLKKVIFYFVYIIYNVIMMIVIVLGWAMMIHLLSKSIPFVAENFNTSFWYGLGFILALFNMIVPFKVLKIKLKKYPESTINSDKDELNTISKK